MKKQFICFAAILCCLMGCNNAVTSVELSKTKLEMAIDDSVTLKASVEPIYATVQAVKWSIDSEEAVTLVDNGDGSCTLTATEFGEAIVTVTTADGGFTETCTVIVKTFDHITDLNFINKVADQCAWYKESDGTVRLSEESVQAIEAVEVLNLSSDKSTPEEERLSDLSEIHRFTGLTELDCSSNNLTQLDVSHNKALEKLDCDSNQLTSLDVSNNTALWLLSCSDNQLTELDLSKQMALEFLSCGHNRLTTLDVSKHTALTDLYCNDNLLTLLYVSRNTRLWDLDCSENQLTSLDVSKNTALSMLGCSNNQLTTLILPNSTELTLLHCNSNRLTMLDILIYAKLKYLSCGRQTSDGTTAQTLILTLATSQSKRWNSTWKIAWANGNVNTVIGY